MSRPKFYPQCTGDGRVLLWASGNTRGQDTLLSELTPQEAERLAQELSSVAASERGKQ